MKKRISGIVLALCLVLNLCPVPASAVDPESGGTGTTESGEIGAPESGETGGTESGETGGTETGETGGTESGETGDPESGETVDPESGETGDPESGGSGSTESGAAGELCVTMHRSGATAATTFALSLEKDGSVVRTDELTAVKGESISTVSLSGIPDGEYLFRMTAEGYLPYVQTTRILKYDSSQEDNCIRLDLYNYASVNDGAGGHGVMPVGDVNKDGVINDADANEVADAIGTTTSKYDLDGDGTVDLKDLTIVVRNEGSTTEATPVYTVSSARLQETLDVTATVGSVTGNAADLLDQQKTDTKVELRPAMEGAISKENPAELTLEPKQSAPENSSFEAEAIVIAPPAKSENTITQGTVTVETSEGPITAEISDDSSDGPAPAALANRTVYLRDTTTQNPSAAKGVKVEADGTVVIDLGKRVAIKKVTIRVTGTSQDNLAEIAKVEFLSDFAQRIPEPQLSIPEVTSVSNTESDGLGFKNLTVKWTAQQNVTGYEVSVSGPGYTKTASTDTSTSYTFQGDSFNGTVKSFQTYQIKVRSVNGDWKSPWSAAYSHTVTCTKVPPAPEYVTATAGVNSLKVSWTCKFDAQWFSLYYKAAGQGTFSVKENLTASNCTLTGLQSGVKYTLYVVAHNENGASAKSADAEGTPTSASGAQLPAYKLINVLDESGMFTTHISSISGAANKSYTIYKADGTTVTNANATQEDWKALLDGQPNSYLVITDWDSGVSYENYRGPTVQLDGKYTINTIRMSPYEGATAHMNKVRVDYRGEDGSLKQMGTSFYTRYDSQNRRYYEVVFDQPITTDYLEVHTTTSYGSTQNYTICELRLYYYDDLEDQVAALFEDEVRTELKSDVTSEQINQLIQRAEETDPVSGESHPHKATILADLEYAKGLLEHNATAKLLPVDNQITAKGNPANGFAQALSDYQPLGCVAAAGDVVVLYVIDKDGKTAKGSNVELMLVATQYHPQVSAWQAKAIQLKAGRNEITIPQISSDAKERGGSLYLQYTGAKGARNYEVRFTGATQIPVLNVDGVTGAERTNAITTYVKELQDYATNVEALHNKLHGAGKENPSVQYDYDIKDCFLNATEITMDNMMYSLPATQVWAAISSDPVGKLETSIAAMEQQIDYFYQFKGLHRSAEGPDAYPFTRLNIRYHQMFTGAFMYAGGRHIGIEFGSTGEMFGMSPVTTDANGMKTGGQLSGWGIAHEIGHCINASAYQRVEVTNNVFPQLAKTDETSASFRTTYDKVYKAVATGKTGHTGDLAVQLAMYWQLHLAYDNNYTFKLYDTVEAQQDGLFYARLESYLRTPSKAPHALTATSGDQRFMQAACAAANKDILDFFRAWGIHPDDATVQYASQYAKETRKIQYINDDSRLYRLERGQGMTGTAVQASITNAEDSRINSNAVNISLSITGGDSSDMLGYEICRNGKVVAFVTAAADKTSYTDIVTTENNRAYVYTVSGVDKLLNVIDTVTLPEVKVCHDGAIDKEGWTATTNMVSVKDTVVEKDEDDPDAGVDKNTVDTKISAIGAALDNDPDTVYYGTTSGGNNRPWVILDLGGVEQVTALKFTPAAEGYTGDAAENSPAAGDLYKYRLFGYKIEVSLDGTSWTTVKEGNTYAGKPSATNPDSWTPQSDVIYNTDGSYTLFFNKQGTDGKLDPFMYTYDAAYVRVTATDMSGIAIAELDVLGPTSDNVDLIPEGIGRLKTDYAYGPDSADTIPAGSIVFTGSFKGDPSYSVVLLSDQDGNTLDGDQVIFAEVPTKGPLGDTSDGRWVYWLDNEAQQENQTTLDELTTVQAKLYRVEDAQTLKGQRLTSTSLTLNYPKQLGDIEITSDQSQTQAYQPDENMIQTDLPPVSEDEQEPSQDLTPSPGGIYADTGSSETVQDPIHLSSNGSSVTYKIHAADGAALAVQTGFTIDPAMSLKAEQDEVGGLYQHSRYNNKGGLELYAVARKGSIGDKILTGTISGAVKDCTVKADSMSWLESVVGPIHNYNEGTAEGEGPAITAEAQITVGGSVTPGPGGGDTPGGNIPGGSDVSGGDSSYNPPTTPSQPDGSGTVSGGQTTVTTTVSSGTAAGTLNSQTASRLVADTPAGGQAVVRVDAPANAAQVSLTLPASAANGLADSKGASLLVDTPLAQVSIPNDSLAALGKDARNVTVTVQWENGAGTLTVSKDKSVVSSLPGGVSVRLAAADNAGTVAVLVNGDGSETILKKTAVVQGSIRVPLPGSASMKLADNSKPFLDVQTHWGKEGVDFVSSRGLFLGTSADGTMFSPDANMSRGMLATVLHRLEDEPTAAGSLRFPDVEGGLWYSDGVAWASASGIITGQGDGSFAPNRDITRQELAVMFYRYAGLLNMDTSAAAGSLARFPDSGTVPGWASEAMSWAVSQGIITGTGAGTLAPESPASRAQVAVMLERLVKLM